MKKQFYFLLFLLAVATSSSAQIKLIGLHYDPGFGTIDVARWDAVSGNVLNAVPTTANGAVSGSSVHDAYAGRYYFKAPSNLVSIGFSPDTVQTLSPVELSTSAEIDMANGKIFGVLPNALYDTNGIYIGSQLEFLEYNILNGTESTIGTIPNNEGVLSDASAYDSNTGTYYFLGIDSALGLCLYSVPTRAPQFSSSKVVFNAGVRVVLDLEFDNQNDILYALAFDDFNLPQRNAEIDVVDRLTGNLSLEMSFPGLETYVSGTSCFDNATGSFIFLAGDSTNNFETRIYNTVSNTLINGTLPFGSFSEFQCDNTAFAFAKYGTVVAAEPLAAAFTVYPNPAQDRLIVIFPNSLTQPIQLEILNAIGQRIDVRQATSTQTDWDCRRLRGWRGAVQSQPRVPGMGTTKLIVR
ncbi:MAG: T9SS type A sorting domain-containing protein [Bacteroidetes bacterium]|nr:T9SS type A sorting domain-containing protein [Bacteroidota bacterium]